MNNFLDDEDIDVLKTEGIETYAAGSNFIQKTLKLAGDNPLWAIGAIVIFGMVANKQGGLKLGKILDLKV